MLADKARSLHYRGSSEIDFSLVGSGLLQTSVANKNVLIHFINKVFHG
jgi:hypothetical protein